MLQRFKRSRSMRFAAHSVDLSAMFIVVAIPANAERFGTPPSTGGAAQ